MVALHNRQLEGGRVITALRTVRALDVTRIFEVVLKELNDRQRYSERDASMVGGANTSSSTTRYPTRNMRLVQADEVSHTDSGGTQAIELPPKSMPGPQTPHYPFRSSVGKGKGGRGANVPPQVAPKPPPPLGIVCWNCKSGGHMQRNCTQPRRTP